MATAKEAKRVVKLEDIKFNKDNKIMAALSCMPLLSFIFFFIEKEDLFVRYHAAQFALISVLLLIGWFPCIGWLLVMAILVFIIIGFIKTLQGERFDVPGVSVLALKLMNSL